jgi:hypothetical protein
MQKTVDIQEEYRQLNRGLMEKMLDRAASDPQWKQQLLEDPEATMQAAGFPEAPRLREIHESLLPNDGEVRGHVYGFEEIKTCQNMTIITEQSYAPGAAYRLDALTGN